MISKSKVWQAELRLLISMTGRSLVEGFRERSIRLMSEVFFPSCLLSYSTLTHHYSRGQDNDLIVCVCVCASIAQMFPLCVPLFTYVHLRNSSLSIVGVFPLMSNHCLTITEGGNWPHWGPDSWVHPLSHAVRGWRSPCSYYRSCHDPSHTRLLLCGCTHYWLHAAETGEATRGLVCVWLSVCVCKCNTTMTCSSQALHWTFEHVCVCARQMVASVTVNMAL